MKNRKANLFILVASVAALLCVGNAALAAGSTVSPAFARMKVSSNLPTDSTSIYVKNDNTVAVSYDASIVDVDTDTGSLIPLDSVSQKSAKLFSVSSPAFTLNPNQSINLIITATNTSELSPGGHYASLILKQKSTPQPTKNVPIQPVISVGLFLVKEDGAVRDLSLQHLTKSSVWFKTPTSETVKISNNGNVDVVPAGFVSIQKGSKLYAKTSFNTESRPLFPQSSTDFKVKYDKPKLIWPGRYKQVIAYRYVGDENMHTIENSVWYVPLWLIFITVGLVLSLVYRLKIRKSYKKPFADTNTAQSQVEKPETETREKPIPKKKNTSKSTKKKSQKAK